MFLLCHHRHFHSHSRTGGTTSVNEFYCIDISNKGFKLTDDTYTICCFFYIAKVNFFLYFINIILEIRYRQQFSKKKSIRLVDWLILIK